MQDQIGRENFTPEDKEHEGQLDAVLQELREMGVTAEDLVGAENLEIGGEGISGRVGNTGWRLRKEGEDSYTVMTSNESQATDIDVARLVEARREKHEGLTEQERARNFWESKLQNEVRIEVPQNTQCEFAIVVPVYNETPERILKQIESLKNQQNIDPAQVEIIYVINNGLPDESSKSKERVVANQAVIEALRNISGLNVHIIDKSSPGNEIPDCNVGKARNRGIAEASLRFYERGENGILIQTDADTYFEDPNYLAKLRSIMTEDQDIIGVAGGSIYEFNPDTNNERELADLRKKLDAFVLKRTWDALVQFLRDPEFTPWGVKDFFGFNMISRSYESAVVGGVIDANSGEDTHFGLDLEAYAAARGQKVVEAKNDLLVVTALRESDRTAASFKKEFDQIDLEKPFMVSDPFVSETLPKFRERIRDIFRKAASDPTDLRNLLTNERGILIVSERAFNELVKHSEQDGVFGEDDFFRQWIGKNFVPGFDLIYLLYDFQYPQIPLTEKNFERLMQRVLQEPRGAEVINNLDTIIGGKIRIP